MTPNLSDILARVDAKGAVTLEEAHAVIYSVKRVCKGRYKNQEKKREYQELRAQGGDVALLDKLNRDYCGADLNEVICKNDPLDGRERILKCARCGLQFATHTFFRLKGRDT